MTEPFSIISWNVNSLRVRLPHVLGWLKDHRPDVLCLQETKVTDDLFPHEPLAEEGYQVVFAGEKTYNGVAILSRHSISEVLVGFDDGEEETQKRLIAATVAGVRIVNTYVPQGSAPDSPKFAYKLAFLKRLEGYFQRRHRPEEQLVWLGDINVAPAAADVYDAQEMEGEVSFLPVEREAVEQIRQWGFEDQFRKFERGAGFYSWWDYRGGAFRRNRGLRIDQIWASAALSARCRSCWMDREARSRERASDHIPVVASYDLEMD